MGSGWLRLRISGLGASVGRVSGLRAFYRPATRTPEPKALDGFEGFRHAEGWGGNGPGLVQHAGCGFKHFQTLTPEPMVSICLHFLLLLILLLQLLLPHYNPEP